jgi:hypothetical protein
LRCETRPRQRGGSIETQRFDPPPRTRGDAEDARISTHANVVDHEYEIKRGSDVVATVSK